MAVSDIDALEVITAVAAVGGEPWIVGGWGVDALLERQTQVHRSLELMVRAEALERCVKALSDKGFQVSNDARPVRVELDDGIGILVLHPVEPDGAGGWWQPLADGQRRHLPPGSVVGGLLGGRTVSCASPDALRTLLGGNPAP